MEYRHCCVFHLTRSILPVRIIILTTLCTENGVNASGSNSNMNLATNQWCSTPIFDCTQTHTHTRRDTRVHSYFAVYISNCIAWILLKVISIQRTFLVCLRKSEASLVILLLQTGTLSFAISCSPLASFATLLCGVEIPFSLYWTHTLNCTRIPNEFSENKTRIIWLLLQAANENEDEYHHQEKKNTN